MALSTMIVYIILGVLLVVLIVTLITIVISKYVEREMNKYEPIIF